MSTVTTLLGLTKPAGIEQFNLATYNNNLDTVDNYAINTVEKLAKGVNNQTVVTTTSGGFTTTLTVISNIATYTFKAGRNYIIVWDAHVSSTVSGDVADLYVATCPTSDPAGQATGLTVKRVKTKVISGAGGYADYHIEAPVTYGVDTTLQIKFAGVRVGGTGTLTIPASANVSAIYRIVDEGDQI